MGATCAPNQSNEDEVVVDIEGVEPNVKFTKIINDYQAENDKLRRQLDEFQNDENGADQDKARQNDEVIRELAEMKAQLEMKDRALVRGRLEAALLSKATSMLESESEAATRLCMEGKLRHHPKGFNKSKKDKWVQIHLSAGELLTNDFKAGYVTVTYSDKKEAHTTNRYQVLEVLEKNAKDLTFAIRVSVDGSVKELIFSCESAEEREDWRKCVKAALDEVKTTYDSMHEIFTLKLTITKPRMGIRVEEQHIEYDEKDMEESDKVHGTMTEAAREVEIDVKKGIKLPEKEVKALEKANVEALSKDDKEEEKEDEKPCELLVTNISDEDLFAAGLVINCIVRAINDTALVGMVYSEQVELLMNTPKPFVLTFTGKNFLKKKPVPKHGYNSILRELVADGENAVKKAFNELVKGTPFERELSSSNDQIAAITSLLSNQRRLMALLQNFTVQEMEL